VRRFDLASSLRGGLICWLACALGACRGGRDAGLFDAALGDNPPADADPFPVLDAGSAGYALSFDGRKDYATAANAGFAAAGAPQTVEMWIKYPPVAGAGEQNLFTARLDDSSGVQIGFRGGALAVWRVYVDRVLVQAPALPAANAWHHVAYTYDGTTHALYVDGTGADAQVNPADDRTPTSVWLGTLDGSRQMYAGEMDEVRVWNVARTAAQVAADQARAPPGAAAGLVAYWTFDDVSSGGRAVDASGTGNTVTLGDGVADQMPSRVVSDAPASR
jgi:hypothetical protein